MVRVTIADHIDILGNHELISVVMRIGKSNPIALYVDYDLQPEWVSGGTGRRGARPYRFRDRTDV